MAVPLRRLRRASGRKYSIEVSFPTILISFLRFSQLKSLKDAIEDHYIFEMFIDELPMWGVIGEVVHEDVALGGYIQGARVYLHTHLYFRIGYNGDKIVTANVTTDARYRKDITYVSAGQEVRLNTEAFCTGPSSPPVA